VNRLGRLLGAFAASFLAAGCDDDLIAIEQPYLLTAINGDPIPWSAPGDTSTRPLRIAEGWVMIHRGGIAERHESLKRWVLAGGSDGEDSTELESSWTQGGAYRWSFDRIIITYPFWAPGQIGPSTPVETLYVSERGITLRQTGFLPPIDSMIRLYAKP
jgi:hypothetical protein